MCLATGCSDVTTTDSVAELETARQKWSEQRPVHMYTIDSRRSCECTTEVTRPIRIEVVDGTASELIAGAIYIDDQSQVPDTARDSLLTVDEVFAEIDTAFAEGAYRIAVQYDSEYGYPRQTSIDYDERVADEELSLQLSNLQP